jgi:hypothetical protein
MKENLAVYTLMESLSWEKENISWYIFFVIMIVCLFIKQRENIFLYQFWSVKMKVIDALLSV